MSEPRPIPSTIAGTAALAIVVLLPGLAMGEPLMDLHDIAVGMPARDLPATGYRDFSCAGKALASWSEWASCPSDGTDGLRAVHVAYDRPDGETKVAGHPVSLTVFFDASGRLARIDIKTDDHVAPYFHKKAYVLARQAKAHYGEEGWTCRSVPATANEEPIGQTYVYESCTKRSAERRIEVNDRLFRNKGGGPRDFVSDATISIGLVHQGAN